MQRTRRYRCMCSMYSIRIESIHRMVLQQSSIGGAHGHRRLCCATWKNAAHIFRTNALACVVFFPFFSHISTLLLHFAWTGRSEAKLSHQFFFFQCHTDISETSCTFSSFNKFNDLEVCVLLWGFRFNVASKIDRTILFAVWIKVVYLLDDYNRHYRGLQRKEKISKFWESFLWGTFLWHWKMHDWHLTRSYGILTSKIFFYRAKWLKCCSKILRIFHKQTHKIRKKN